MTPAPKTYVINLARRRDRLERMTEQLAALDIPFSRVDAIDAKAVADADIDGVFTAGKYGPMSKGDKCCNLSHMRCWNMFVESGARHAVVLEDDVVIHTDATALLSDLSWLPEDVHLVKIESFGSDSQRILVGKPLRVATGTSIAPLHSKHTGSAAYIVSSWLATWLLSEVRVHSMTVDHLLFNPHISPITDRIHPYQLIPAIAKQVSLKQDTDIDEWRIPLRVFGLASVKRSIRRAYNDLRIVPRQAIDIFTGTSRLIRI
jgi:glycosyl transferase family 25